MSNLQPNCCLKVDFQKVDKHTGGQSVTMPETPLQNIRIE